MLVGHGVQPSLEEQAVDVYPDVVMVERQVHGPSNGQAVGCFVLPRTGRPFGRLAIKKDRPTLLEEGEERLAVRQQRLKRPVVETAVVTLKLDEPLIEDCRDTLALIVTAQQYLQ